MAAAVKFLPNITERKKEEEKKHDKTLGKRRAVEEEMEEMEEISQKRIGDGTEGWVGGKRIRLDNEGCSSNNEEKEPEMEIKKKDEEIEKLRQQLALRIESEEIVKANYDNLVGQLVAKVECPVCFEVPKSAPIYSCVNGHLVCIWNPFLHCNFTVIV